MLHGQSQSEMAALFIDLANDDPSATDFPNASKLLEVENRIAEGIFTAQTVEALRG
jgi:hypothetical protein